MFAAGRRLDNLVAIVDYNKLQAMGRSDEVTGLAPLADKWRAFGWGTQEIDGHDLTAVVAALDALPIDARPAERDRRPHRQGQGRVVHGRRPRVALPAPERRRSRARARRDRVVMRARRRVRPVS